ncbi:blue copper protein-like [Rutidosis leptorrhynchoides]|uniref:blue copper protein-like n=1 Tax=Rutidosis leptorrhynchoides TaxID=125765 RepID=UPI003A9A0C24
MEIKKFSIFILVAMILAVHTSASEIIEVDWNNGVDFKTWEARTFHLNDMLVFKYEAGKHNMLIVNEKFYNSCFVCPIAKPHDTGDDHILLDKPGKWYFIDGIENGKNCKENNVKLVIEVTDKKPLQTSMKVEYDFPEAKRYIQVGDEVGWNPSVDFEAWAQRLFEFNDLLSMLFQPYTLLKFSNESMLIVDEGSYNKCFVCPIAKPHDTGNDKILLDRAGKWYFIDAIENGKYCKENNMKLAIDVAEPKKDSGVQGARKLGQYNN